MNSGRSPLSPERLAKRLAMALDGGRSDDLVQAMLHEMDSIADPVERSRFGLGIIVALLRLRLSGRLGSPTRRSHPHSPDSRGHPMLELTSAGVLRRHVAPFVLTVVTLTTLSIATSPILTRLFAGEAPFAGRTELLLVAMPAILALTFPMAVFVAVLWAFIRLGREGHLSRTLHVRHGIRRLILVAVGAATVLASLLLIANAELLPRSNQRFAEIIAGGPVVETDRSMTLGELHEAARTARAVGDPASLNAAQRYEVEIHKKISLAASCLFLALAAAIIGIRYHRGGVRVALAASTIVFAFYYLSLIGGEALADDGRISPIGAMWMGNGALLVAAILLGWRAGRSGDMPVERVPTPG